MSKITTIFTCSKCGAQYPKWTGRCSECSSWGTIVQETKDAHTNNKDSHKQNAIETIDLATLKKQENKRLSTGLIELDRVFGGGLVPGSLILLGGEPGIGKSTIVAQIVNELKKNKPVLYVSGEESANQVKDRLERLNINFDNLHFLAETNTEKIAATAIKLNPELLVIDSIQTVYSNHADSEAGSLSQIRASAVSFLEVAKQHDITTIIIGHITKDGQLAGPKSLEHIVDVVLYLETESSHNYRILRSSKNRFGSVNELGIFDMTVSGFKEVKNPGSIFLDVHNQDLSGSVISCVMEGSRPFLVEVQALVTKTIFGYPQRKASGYDINRLQVLTAVLMKRANLNLTDKDIILNVVGGLKINDPALDLAVCTAVISSLTNIVINRQTLIIGEVGLGGEIRNVSKLDVRLNEASKLGFTKVLTPVSPIQSKKTEQINLKNVSDLVEYLAKN
ncbi:MAG: DNA repair protein RadA [bacterium]